MRDLQTIGLCGSFVLLFAWGCASAPPPAPEAPPSAAVTETASETTVASSSGDSKAASEQTKRANAALKQALPFNDQQDFADAQKGFLGTWEEPTIKDAKGQPVWDFGAFSFVKGEAPAEVNPSLWRMAQLNSIHGLFQVTDNIFQVRGFDLSVTSFIEGKTGVVVVDPLLTKETAAAALAVYRKYRGNKPIVAMIYTHSHVDHFGGVRGMIDEKAVQAGEVKVVAPEGFMEHAVSENVFAGTAMSRRATYMYGPLLPKNAQGTVDAGLGKTTSTGEVTLIPPTDSVQKTGQKMRLAGLEFVFFMAPGTEAPSEMLFYIPEYKALCSAEDVTHTLHNVLTLRGAQVRDPLVWSRYLNDLLGMWGKDVEVMFASHHWPTWGNEPITKLIKSQRDLYKYINDQTLHLANQGYTMIEIGERMQLPPELDKVWANRNYYGTLNHNVKAVYQRYLGWFDGNPSTLHQLPPEEAGKKYVEAFGGAEAAMRQAKTSFDAGDYRWAAQLLNHVVFAEPKNDKARFLLADALEQLGYQAESGPWRGFYLTGAMELRQGVRNLPAPDTASADVVAGMTPEMFLDYLAVRLDPAKAAGKKLSIALVLTSGKQKQQEYTIVIENSVLNYSAGKATEPADSTITLDQPTLFAINGGKLKLADAVQQKKAKVDGDTNKLHEFVGLFDNFEFWFPIVTP